MTNPAEQPIESAPGEKEFFLTLGAEVDKVSAFYDEVEAELVKRFELMCQSLRVFGMKHVCLESRFEHTGTVGAAADTLPGVDRITDAVSLLEDAVRLHAALLQLENFAVLCTGAWPGEARLTTA